MVILQTFAAPYITFLDALFLSYPCEKFSLSNHLKSGHSIVVLLDLYYTNRPTSHSAYSFWGPNFIL